MCSRYSLDETVCTWLAIHSHGTLTTKSGDIRPNETVPVLIAGNRQPLAVPMAWGMKREDIGALVINARSETLWEKPLFRNAIKNRRCLAPASCFYEWDSEKHRATFHGEAANLLFMAAIYQDHPGGSRFAIITAPADEAVRPVHNRMPVLISEDLIGAWLLDAAKAKDILAKSRVPLTREQSAEQMSLW